MPKEVGGASSHGRKIGYWQSSNIKKRSVRDGKYRCPPVAPGDIQYQGFTHLYYAFGAINPVTFKIVDDPSKRGLYREFTALRQRPNGPQTWIAVGGFDFSDPGVTVDVETDDHPGVSTHTTWSNMASNPSSRAAFINSLRSFMTAYGF